MESPKFFQRFDTALLLRQNIGTSFDAACTASASSARSWLRIQPALQLLSSELQDDFIPQFGRRND